MLIPSESFSVVVQGPIAGKRDDPPEVRRTRLAIESVRAVLPGSQVILSTWKGSDVEGLDVDKLLLNDDPGAISYDDKPGSGFNNLNRQIVSTQRGLSAADRPYAVKLRSDSRLLHAGFRSFIGKYPVRFRQRRLFREPIIVPAVGSRDPRRVPLLFHLSDLFQVGRLDDLRDLWSCPLAPEPETTRWQLLKGVQSWVNPHRDTPYHFRCSAEQYLVLCRCRASGYGFDLAHPAQLTLASIIASLQLTATEYVVVSPEALGVELPQHLACVGAESWSLSHDRWLHLHGRVSVSPNVGCWLLAQVARVMTSAVAFTEVYNVLYQAKNSLKRKLHAS